MANSKGGRKIEITDIPLGKKEIPNCSILELSEERRGKERSKEAQKSVKKRDHQPNSSRDRVEIGAFAKFASGDLDCRHRHEEG